PVAGTTAALVRAVDPAQLLPPIREVDDDGRRRAVHRDLRSGLDPARQSKPAAVQRAVRQSYRFPQRSRAGRGARRRHSSEEKGGPQPTYAPGSIEWRLQQERKG